MTALQARKTHLANLLTAIQRSVYFLAAAERKLPWPLLTEDLAVRKKDVSFFETLSAYNERYAKLQDLLGATMRHAAFLLGERTDEFLHVLAWFEKQGVVDSMETWQALRVARNQAALSTRPTTRSLPITSMRCTSCSPRSSRSPGGCWPYARQSWRLARATAPMPRTLRPLQNRVCAKHEHNRP